VGMDGRLVMMDHLLGDPTVKSENGEPDKKDKQDGSEQGDCK
jgi:hypothetical protein